MQNTSLKNVLADIKMQVEKSKPVMCIFDLDSTLFDLTDRKQEILKAFLKEPKETYQHERQLLKQAQVHKNEFGIDQALSRVGITEKNHSELYKEIITFFEHFFFHNDFIGFDKTVLGAVEFVEKVSLLGANIIYLTGRDEPRMLKGTLESLKAAGFPLGGDKIDVCLKPHLAIEDHHFKLDFMRKLIATRELSHVWLFENEPVNINLIERHFPETHFVFIDSNHSGKETVGEHHFKIKNFLLP